MSASYDLKGKFYDFRSDAVSKPTPAMLQAMINAVVGDDVHLEDPTAVLLQEKVARLCGMEDALYVPTGVMSNQLAIRTHVTQNSYKQTVAQSVIIDARSHVYKYELGGLAFHSGIQANTISGLEHGEFLTADLIEKNIFLENDYHGTATTIISLENTQGGSIYPIEEIEKIKKLADRHDIRMHLDGARLWNACIATGIDMATYCKNFDSVSVCLSKGLGAPIGSVLVGKKDFIAKARQYRKMFGGGMRQIGYMCACGIYAIDNNWPLMKNDHENAKILHEGLTKLGFEVTKPETNILFANSTKLNISVEQLVEGMNEINKRETDKVVLEGGGYTCRMVVHLQTPLEGVQKLISNIEEVLKNRK